MKISPLVFLAALSILASFGNLNADDSVRLLKNGIPTMAYYTKGGVIYYGYTAPGRGHPLFSTILATNPAYARAHYQTPTMAYYTKEKVIFYGYTNYLPYPASAAPDWRKFEPPYRLTSNFIAEAIPLTRTVPLEAPPEQAAVKTRIAPLAYREALEQEDEQTRGTWEENMAMIRSSPVDGAGFYKRGNAYKETQDFIRAIRDYDEVIRLDPENAYAYYKRGLCYTALNRMDLASYNFHRANEIMADREEPWAQKSRSWSPQSGY